MFVFHLKRFFDILSKTAIRLGSLQLSLFFRNRLSCNGICDCLADDQEVMLKLLINNLAPCSDLLGPLM